MQVRAQTTYQSGTLHDGLLATVRQRHGELREVHEHLSHLISALSAAHVDDTVTVTVLAQRLTDNGLATAESARDSARPCMSGLHLNCFSTGLVGCNKSFGPQSSHSFASHNPCR